METFANIAYAIVSALAICGMWIGVGFIARFVVWLFCIGYGCT